MTIAIPIWQERVSPVLDTATRLLVVTRRQGKESKRAEVVLAPQNAEILAASVAELHVTVLLCAAVSEPLRRALEKRGVRIHQHLCGNANLVLEAYCCGTIRRREFRMPGCWGYHTQGACRKRPTSGP
jgi:predicted Fe-Mo cluster-binding NifX family protein